MGPGHAVGNPFDARVREGGPQEFTIPADGTSPPYVPIRAAKALVKKSYLYTNNHFSAKSVANATMIKHQIGEPIEGEYSSAFIDRYPELASIVTCEVFKVAPPIGPV